MFQFNRTMLATIGAAAMATAVTTALFSSPAQAATTGTALLVGTKGSIVRFTAAAGQANSLVITVSGRTFTLAS